MLFAPPQPPFALSGCRTMLLGRSRDCDLRFADTDTSRRHAEIVARGEHFEIHDLGSTNGTWVNGTLVEQRELAPGDRIEIGTNLITFCIVEVDLADGDDSEVNTVLFERPAHADVFRGDLGEIPPFAVLQTLEMGRKSGVLSVESEAAAGRLWLSRGDPIHAETGGQVGFDAALAIVGASAGRFVFEPKRDLPEATIDASVTQLLLEASRLLDEGPAAR